MKHKLLALFTAGMMLASASALPSASAADQPSMDSVIGTLPDWTPMNFDDALQFYNTYGKSHVEDNFICLVKPIYLNEKDCYKTSYSGSIELADTPVCTSVVYFEADSSSFITDYVFEVQMFRVPEGYDLTVTWTKTIGDKDLTLETFSFENQYGYTEQTDSYSWLPDCITEYDAFLAKNGRAFVYDNYVVYCEDVNASTGASLKMEQTGEGAIEMVKTSGCTEFIPIDLAGNPSSSVIVYQPTVDGLVDVEWSVGRQWSDEASFDITNGSYHIKNDCTEIVDLSNGSTIITFINQDTGELIDIPENSSFLKSTIQHSPDEPLLDELFPIDSNPCVIDSTRAYDPNCSYSFDIRTEDGYYDFHGFEVTSETSNRVEVTCKLSYKTNPAPVLPDGATRITLYDKDTGELIPDEVIRLHNFTFGTNIGYQNDDVPGGWMYTGPFFTVDSNSFVLEIDQLASHYKYADLFEFCCEDQPEVIYYSNDSMDLIFRIKIELSGDLNGDDEFSVVDAIALQKWLLRSDQVEIYYLEEGDLDLNGKLDAFDLAIMKLMLVQGE